MIQTQSWAIYIYCGEFQTGGELELCPVSSAPTGPGLEEDEVTPHSACRVGPACVREHVNVHVHACTGQICMCTFMTVCLYTCNSLNVEHEVGSGTTHEPWTPHRHCLRSFSPPRPTSVPRYRKSSLLVGPSEGSWDHSKQPFTMWHSAWKLEGCIQEEAGTVHPSQST